MATKDKWSLYAHVKIWMWMIILFVLVNEEIRKLIHTKNNKLLIRVPMFSRVD